MSKKDVLSSETNALAAVAGPFRAFSEKLMGEEGLLWLQAFKRFLRKENPWPTEVVPKSFPVWKTITVGGKSKKELLAELEAKRFNVGDWAKDMMAQKAFTTAFSLWEVDLVTVTVLDLGFPKGATTQEIWSKAKDLSLNLCPAEVGPHLRLAYADQPQGEYLWVAIKQITDSDSTPRVFKVGRDGGERWLHGDGARPEGEWDPDRLIVFVLPCK